MYTYHDRRNCFSTVEAVQWFKMGDHEAVELGPRFYGLQGYVPYVKTFLSRFMQVRPGDWVIQDGKYSFSVMKDTEFRRLYEVQPEEKPSVEEQIYTGKVPKDRRMFGRFKRRTK